MLERAPHHPKTTEPEAGSPLDDVTVLEQVAAGDSRALRHLYDAHAGWGGGRHPAGRAPRRTGRDGGVVTVGRWPGTPYLKTWPPGSVRRSYGNIPSFPQEPGQVNNAAVSGRSEKMATGQVFCVGSLVGRLVHPPTPPMSLSPCLPRRCPARCRRRFGCPVDTITGPERSPPGRSVRSPGWRRVDSSSGRT